jgi:hypothetical protein
MLTNQLDLPKSMRIHLVFHVFLLWKAEPNPIAEWQPSSTPFSEVQDGIEKWDIECIDDSQICYRKLQYILKWLDFPLEEHTWELAQDL